MSFSMTLYVYKDNITFIALKNQLCLALWLIKHFQVCYLI